MQVAWVSPEAPRQQAPPPGILPVDCLNHPHPAHPALGYQGIGFADWFCRSGWPIGLADRVGSVLPFQQHGKLEAEIWTLPALYAD